MASLLEHAKDLVMAHTSRTTMTSKEIVAEIHEVYAALQSLEKGQAVSSGISATEEKQAPAISKRKAFGKDKVICMICGREMKTLARHLGAEHGIKPSEYRRQFDVPRTQPLAARSYSESRRQMAQERDLGANLAKARAARGKGKKTAPAKAARKSSRKEEAGGPPANE